MSTESIIPSPKMNLRFKQKWGLLFLLLITVIYFVIFSLMNEKKKTQITELFFADKITAAHKILIDKYNKLNEGKIKVVPIDFPNFDFSTNERKEMLARSLRGRGDGIDLFAVDLVWVQRFAKWSEPLAKYFSEEEKDRILPTSMESCYSDGDLVAVPLDMVQGIMYYREDLLKKIPGSDKIIEKIRNNITWNEFINLQKNFSKEGVFYVFPAADNEGFICIFMELLLSLNRNYFEQKGFYLETPEAEKALQLIVDFVNRYKTTPEVVTEFTEIPSYEYFIKNDGIFIRGWNSYDKDFEESHFDKIKESHLRKAPIPYFESGTPASVLGGWNLMVSKFSGKKEEAVDFIKFLLKEESQEIFYKVSGYYPVVNSFYEEPEYLKKYPEIEEFKRFMRAGVHRPSHIDYTRFSNLMSFYFKKAIQEEISVKEALRECTNAIQAERMIIKEY